MSARNPSLRDGHEYILVYSKQRYAREGESHTYTISREDFLECASSLGEFPPESAKRIEHSDSFPLPRRQLPPRK